MAHIAALLTSPTDRSALLAAAEPHEIAWAGSWHSLFRIVRTHPIATVVADPRAEPRKDGALRVLQFRERFPLTPLLAWGRLDGRDLYRLGKAGASEVVLDTDAQDSTLVRELIEHALDPGLASILDTRLRGRVEDGGRALIRFAADRVPRQVQVPELARHFGVSVSTLERRCEQWGLPTPGRLLLWLRVIWGLHWLLEPGRSVESVAEQLGYSSGAAFRRAIKSTIGGRPTPLRNAGGLDRALDAFIAECPGDAAIHRLSATR